MNAHPLRRCLTKAAVSPLWRVATVALSGTVAAAHGGCTDEPARDWHEGVCASRLSLRLRLEVFTVKHHPRHPSSLLAGAAVAIVGLLASALPAAAAGQPGAATSGVPAVPVLHWNP
jgi:hypothetical protein